MVIECPIDSIGSSTSTKPADSKGNSQALTQILIEFTRIQNSNSKIYLICATNYAASLDCRLIRRFSSHLHISPPNKVCPKRNKTSPHF